MSSGRWNEWTALEPIRPLSECTLGLVGLGRIGRELLRQIGGLFGRTLAHDPYAVDLLPAGTTHTDLDDLIARSDVLSLHCPLTPDTRHIIGRDRLALMPPGSLLVNVARGGLVDTAALLDALDKRRPSAAALDVLETEPPRHGAPVIDHPRILHTPHVAWYSTEAAGRLRTSLAHRCASHLIGRPGATVVNPQAEGV
ncbi:phosphoglycerate dehydrogenase-like enzyme [Spinactinospora alkalitolerans]|uniref:Phosphoglycerate dehydrogenase-like enzyme n=1 Tax=Spinactinospora alkalitolerans TaxID=687207 RepID=A0A852TYV0_9ACTN|nr:phosphoglycerate dehydrogenase-like enzyme [Spinactinospora alkalitolerans]